MYRIKTLNKISPAGRSVLDQTRYTISTDVENEDGILVRSADMHDYAFPDALRAVARAGAGTNNIPIDRCSEAGIVVFNTPGANANAVKELAVCALLLASRKAHGTFFQSVLQFIPDCRVSQRFLHDLIQLRFVPDSMCPRSVGYIVIDTHRKRIRFLKSHTHPFPEQINVHISVNIFSVQSDFSRNLTSFHQIIHTV